MLFTIFNIHFITYVSRKNFIINIKKINTLDNDVNKNNIFTIIYSNKIDYINNLNFYTGHVGSM